MSNSQKFAERLVILGEMGVGLKARLAHTADVLTSPGGRPYVLRNDQFGKLRKNLKSHFPDLASAERVQGYQEFMTLASSTMLELREIYTTFLEVLEWKEAVFDTLTNMGQDVVEFDFSKNSTAVGGFLALLTSYAQVHLFWAQLEDRHVLLAAYALAVKCSEGAVEHDFARVAAYVQAYEQPLRHLVEEFQPLSTRVGDMIAPMNMLVASYFSPTVLRAKDTFNPIANGDRIAFPANQPIYHQLLHADEIVTWLTYACLVCPAELQRPEIMALFNTVCGDAIVVPLIRGRVLKLHEELEQLFAWFPPKALHINFGRDVKIKRVMTELSKRATLECGQQHRERRAYIRGSLQTLLALFQECPGLLGPKFPMVLALMSMARAEVLWVLRHHGQMPPKKRVKYYEEANFHDPHLGALVFYIDELTTLITANKAVIQRYYVEYLQGAHRAALQPLLTTVVNNNVTGGATQLLNSFLPAIDGLRADALDANDLRGFRLNWARTVDVFTSSRTNCLRMPGVNELLQRMTTVVLHSEAVDNVEQLLRAHTALSELTWFQTPVEHAFDVAIRGADFQPQYVCAFLRTMTVVANNVHPFCPEEQSVLGEQAVRRSEGMLDVMSRRILDMLEGLTHQLTKLNDQVVPCEAVNRLKRQQAAARSSAGKGQSEPVAGFESSPYNRACLAELVATERNMAQLCWAISRTEPIVVYDRVFVPREYLREQLVHGLKAFLARQAADPAHPDMMRRPVELLRAIRLYTYACGRALAHVNIEFGPILRDVLLGEFTDPAVGVVGTALGPGRLNAGSPALIYSITQCFRGVVAEAPMVAPFSDFAGGPVSLVRDPHERYRLENFFHRNELQALCCLIGAAGVRVIDAGLLDFVMTQVEQMKSVLQANRAELINFGESYHTPAWAETVARMQDLDTLLHTGVRAGKALSLRRMLREALGEVSRQYVPFYAATAASARAHYGDNVFGNPMFAFVDGVAEDLGLDIGGADHSLKAHLQHLNASSEDAQLWDLLPQAFAASFTAPAWRGAEYHSEIDAFKSNEHTYSLAIQKLLFVFNSMAGAAPPATPTGDQPVAPPSGIERAIARFVDMASFVLLHMKQAEKTAFAQMPIRGMVVFLESFVATAPHTDRSVLELHLPYALVHAAHFDIARGVHTANDRPVDSVHEFAAEDEAMAGAGAALES